MGHRVRPPPLPPPLCVLVDLPEQTKGVHPRGGQSGAGVAADEGTAVRKEHSRDGRLSLVRTQGTKEVHGPTVYSVRAGMYRI